MVKVAQRDWGWKRVNSETKVLSPKEALEFAVAHNSLPQSPTEREFEQKRYEELKDVLATGRSISYYWAVVDYAGKKFRMNGRHSSQAIVEFEGSLPGELVFHVDTYKALTQEGMASLFQQFDARWSSRSKLDISGAHQGLNQDIADCDRKDAQIAIEGVAWYRQKAKLSVPSGDDVYQLFFDEELSAYVKWVDGTFSDKTNEMKRKPVTAAMYATFDKNEAKAREFWKQVAIGTLADDAEPAAMLSKVLQDDKVNRKKHLPFMTDGDIYGSCLNAWNAFCQNVKPRSVVFSTKKGKDFPAVAA